MSFPQPSTWYFRWGAIPVATAFVVAAMWQPVAGQGQPGAAPAPGGAGDGQEVLTRGPIHEAFGQPTVFNPKPGFVIPKAPPQPIEELPPEEKPEGDHISWIGGYWSWDDDKKDFLWVSGFWRALPPSRQWMPGYWNETGGQYQWVSGYWASAQAAEQEFIAQAPPASLEQGAPATAPTEEHVWVPGSWVYHTSRYLWRPGYWIGSQPGWVWIPASYYWTPSGYVFIDGYWDYSIRRRGVLFAPVYFDPVVVVQPRFYYRPAICLDIDLITPHFFCRPTYGHYYFGDYYATSYLSVGITPWFSFYYSRGVPYYSPDFTYYAAHYRRADPQWAVNIRIGYESRRDNVAFRPPHTFRQQTTIINNTTIVNNKTVINNNMVMAKPLKDVSAAAAKNVDAPMKFQKISDTQAKSFAQTSAEVRKVGQQRVALERSGGTGATGKTGSTAVDGGVRRVSLPKSPLVAKTQTDTTTGAGNAGKNLPAVGNLGGAKPSNVPPPIPGAGKLGGAVTDNTKGTGKNDTGTDRSGRLLPGGSALDKSTLDKSTLPGKGADRLPPLNPRDAGSTGKGGGKSTTPPAKEKGSTSGKEKDKGKDK